MTGRCVWACVSVALIWGVASAVSAGVPGSVKRARHYAYGKLVPGEFNRANMQLGDLNNDGVVDFLVYENDHKVAALADTTPPGSTAPESTLQLLWHWDNPAPRIAPAEGYQYKPVIWDIDQDGQSEVIMSVSSARGGKRRVALEIRDGATGMVEQTVMTPVVQDTSKTDKRMLRIRLAAANFRGLPQSQDVVLVTETDSKGDIWAFDHQGTLLWDTTDDNSAQRNKVSDYIYAHFPWIYDLDGDGKDELLARRLFDSDGRVLAEIIPHPAPMLPDLHLYHLDRAVAADVDPRRPRLEIVVSREFKQAQVFSFVAGAPGSPGMLSKLWDKGSGGDDKLLAVGEFDASNPGLELVSHSATGPQFLRSALDGRVLKKHNRAPFNDEALLVIDWDGDRTQDELYHVKRGGALWDPRDGSSVNLEQKANAAFVSKQPSSRRATGRAADILGDGREEIIIQDDNEILIYTNGDPNPNPKPSPWMDWRYRLLIANQMSDNHPERNFFAADVGTAPPPVGTAGTGAFPPPHGGLAGTAMPPPAGGAGTGLPPGSGGRGTGVLPPPTAPSAGPSTNAGCGCSLPGQPPSAGRSLCLVLAGVLLLTRRRLPRPRA